MQPRFRRRLNLSTIASGSSDSIVINAKATKAGHLKSKATIQGLSTNIDPNANNNAATAGVLVLTNAICTVPKLVGHTLSKAKELLKAAHCALGKVTKPNHHKGTLIVIGQHPAAGKHLSGGGRVAVKLGHK